MGKYVQKHKNTGYEVDGQELAREDAAKQKQDRKEQSEKIKAASDDLMAEIDEALADAIGEDTAQQFVKDFVQKGGQ